MLKKLILCIIGIISIILLLGKTEQRRKALRVPRKMV